MLCVRSVSLTTSTRMSCDMASTSLRKLAACFSEREGSCPPAVSAGEALRAGEAWRAGCTPGCISRASSSRESLVTPSTSADTSGPNRSVTSSRVARVSSTVSCRSPVMMEGRSASALASIEATSSGCVTYGSPEARYWRRWYRRAKTNASHARRAAKAPSSPVAALTSSCASIARYAGGSRHGAGASPERSTSSRGRNRSEADL
mmetsp:Transcript_6166/g.20709  ORF Transcript_6166/g.20709 Transcript_6166/m.20709 type:complete len:205 (+) Transcript_6166:299-913(+)